MSIELIIEDGSGVVDANSYVSLNDANEWAVIFGYPILLSITHLIKATQFLETLQYCGQRSFSYQGLSLPRIGIVLPDNRPVPSNVIPRQIIEGQALLACEIAVGNDPTAFQSPGVKREKVDVIEIEYTSSAPVKSMSLARFPLVANLLRGIVCPQSSYIERA